MLRDLRLYYLPLFPQVRRTLRNTEVQKYNFFEISNPVAPVFVSIFSPGRQHNQNGNRITKKRIGCRLPEENAYLLTINT